MDRRNLRAVNTIAMFPRLVLPLVRRSAAGCGPHDRISTRTLPRDSTGEEQEANTYRNGLNQ